MNEIIDVPMKGQRDLATVTAEIRSYCTAAQTMMVTYAIEIGRRLVEAKSMVKHGEWGDYLREELGLSQSTANNHMKLFEGYAAGQISLTGAALKNQAFANLTYTKALALLALPSEEEREAFVEAHDVGSMSTRELQEELRKRGEAQDETPPHPSPAATPALEDASSVGTADATARKNSTVPRTVESPQGEGFGTEDAEGLRKALEAMKGLRKQDAEHVKEIEAQAYQAHQARDEALKAQDAAKKAAAEAEAKANEAGKKMLELRSEIEKAKAREKNLKAELENAKQNPKIPQATLDKLKAEAEEAARKAMEAEGRTEDLNAAKARYEAAELEASKARQEAERLEKELKLASPGVAVFRDQFARLQRDLGILINSIDELPEDKQAGARKGLHTILRNYLDMLEEPEEEAQG